MCSTKQEIQRTISESYFHFDSALKIVSAWDVERPLNDSHWMCGNYFNTIEQIKGVMSELFEVMDDVKERYRDGS